LYLNAKTKLYLNAKTKRREGREEDQGNGLGLLVFEIFPRGDCHQNDRNDPKRGITHACFLGHGHILSQIRWEKSKEIAREEFWRSTGVVAGSAAYADAALR
jgi:hypothetical protein